jgi:DNA replication protein DnaC
MSFDWNVLQETIYNKCAAHIIENVLEGYNGTIFAYGQTGTGKTHTMTGVQNDNKEKGIMPRSFEDVFARIESDSE